MERGNRVDVMDSIDGVDIGADSGEEIEEEALEWRYRSKQSGTPASTSTRPR